MNYRVEVAPHAVRDLKHLDRTILKRIDQAIQSLADNPYPKQTKPLVHLRLAAYRLRVGDWRILYDIDRTQKVVVILRVGHRREIYR